jgi:hypothetical protein
MVWCPAYPLDRNRCDQVVHLVVSNAAVPTQAAATTRTSGCEPPLMVLMLLALRLDEPISEQALISESV